MRLIEKNGMLGIDKKEIDALIAKKNFIGLNRSPRSEKVIVSLTSYKPRINDVKYTLYSLLNQTFPPDKLILWLDEDSFPQREKNLPRDLLKFKSLGLTIDWCENLRPYKKLIPALEKYPDDIIVTADDDLFYRPDWLKILYDEHLREQDSIIAHYTHKVRLNTNATLFPFKQWYLNLNPQISLPPMLSYSFGTGGGVLLKKKFFHADVLKRELFRELAPIADDLWVWAMAVLNGTKIKIPANPISLNSFINVEIDSKKEGDTLTSKNWNEEQYDVQLRQIIKHYPAFFETLIREDVDSKPYISVILPIRSFAPPHCLESIFAQSFPDFELIIINLGARTDFPPLPTNFRVINYPGGLLVNALNLGLQKSEGEYVLFADENSLLPREGLDIVAKAADASKADVVHFAGHVQIFGNNLNMVFDDAPELLRDKPTLFNVTRQNCAKMFLQNKLSRRLDTKIFKREFLTKHGINFDDGTEEFLFAALTQAEKYLLVPQAFCSIRN